MPSGEKLGVTTPVDETVGAGKSIRDGYGGSVGAAAPEAASETIPAPITTAMTLVVQVNRVITNLPFE